MKRLKKNILSVLIMMTALFGVSMTASAADTETADFNSGLPEGWTLVGSNIYNDNERSRNSGKGVWSNGKSATDNYLVTENIEGTLSLYWRSFGTSSSYPNGTLYIYKYSGNALGELITQTSSYKSATWKQESFDLGTYKGKVAIALYSACIDDVTYTSSESGGGEGGGGGDTPEPQPDPAPVMGISITTVNFGQVTDNASQDVTVSNTGNAELVVAIASDNADFTVSKANLTVAAGETGTFTISYQYNAEAYGAHTATVTVTPNAGEPAAIAVSAYVRDPNVWSEDFEGNALPDGWTIVGSEWTFEDGKAKGKFNGYDNWLVTPKLAVKDGELMTFQAMSYQYGTDIVLQYQKDDGNWTQYFSEARNTQTEFETYTVSGLEAGTYRFRIRTENLYLDNFEGFALAPSTAVTETWHISYTFHYNDAGGEQTEEGTEDIKVEFDGDKVGFYFPNPMNGNAWMYGTRYEQDNIVYYIFPMGQYVGKFQGESVYYCGGANDTLTDMQFFYNDDDKAFFNFEHVLLNGSTTVASLWGYFSDVVIYKNEKPVIEPTGIESLTPDPSPKGEGSRYNLRGQKVDSSYKGIVIQNGKKYLKK